MAHCSNGINGSSINQDLTTSNTWGPGDSEFDFRSMDLVAFYQKIKGMLINFRNISGDTVTRPGLSTLLAIAHAQVGDDVYGEDVTTNELQV